MVLPSFFTLHEPESNYSKYVRYINEDVPERGFLSISALGVVSPFTRFETVVAESDDKLVHIKCSYNNKYWVTLSEDNNKIVAGAIQQEEDQSKWSCTLFEPIFEEYDCFKVVKFRHVNLNYYIHILLDAPLEEESWLYAGEEITGSDYWNRFSVTDLDSLMIMPKYVAFKGDDGSYLGTSTIGNQLFIKSAVDDINDPSVMFEIFTTYNGYIYIKNVHADKFWKCNSEWILLEEADSDCILKCRDYDLLFLPTKVEKIVWPTKIEKNDLILRNIGNNLVCRRVPDFSNHFSPIDPVHISLLAELEIEEPVTSRRIYDVEYFVSDSSIYGETVVEIAVEEAENKSEYPVTQDVKIIYADVKTNCWKSSASLKLRAVPTIVETDAPFVEEGNIKISSEAAGSFEYKWGEDVASESTMETVITVTVPPKSSVMVKLTATKTSFDVPFSYSQLDTLINEKEIPYSMKDGVYTGTYCFNYQYETEEYDNSIYYNVSP